MVFSKSRQSRAQPWLSHSSDGSYHLSKQLQARIVAMQAKIQYSEESKTLICLGVFLCRNPMEQFELLSAFDE